MDGVRSEWAGFASTADRPAFGFGWGGCSKELRGSDADMFRGDQLGFLMGGSDEGSPSEVVGASQEATGALLDGGDGVWGEERLGDAGDLEMVVEVGFHVGSGDAVEMGAGDDSGGERERCAVEEEVCEVVLAGEDDGEDGVGVGMELGDGVKFSEDLNSE